MKVLFTGCTFSEDIKQQLKLKDIVVDFGAVNYSEKELINILKDYNCYINGGDEICTRKVIKNNQHLKLISFMGTGYQKYIDVETAKEYNIPVSYTPSANAKSVAEHTVALILDSVKKITFTNNEIKNGMWNKYETFNLENKTLGIVGMGAVGSYIAKILCNGFGMKLIYNSQGQKGNINKEYNTRMVDIKTLFKDADIISINATCTEKNKGMITKEQLSLMKKNSVIVNTARAELINKEDLFELIQTDKNINLAMDGFYEEPLQDTNNKFLRISDDRFLITSHNAYNSKDAICEMEKMLIESLEDIINGEKEIRNIVW